MKKYAIVAAGVVGAHIAAVLERVVWDLVQKYRIRVIITVEPRDKQRSYTQDETGG